MTWPKYRKTKYYLIWICVKVEVFQEPGGKLTEQEVVGLIDCPQTPVCVVIGTGAGAERTHYNTHTKKTCGHKTHYKAVKSSNQ